VPLPSKLHEPQNLPWQARGALSVEHAAEVLGLTGKHVYDLIAAGKIQVIRPGGRRMVIAVSEIFRQLGRKTPKP
jgi:excisionase family DNA binding protein